MAKLSDRLRPNLEAAPWVIEEAKRMENLLGRIVEAGENCANLMYSNSHWSKNFDEPGKELSMSKPKEVQQAFDLWDKTVKLRK